MAVNPGKRMVILMSNEITIQDVFNGANSVIKYPGRYHTSDCHQQSPDYRYDIRNSHLSCQGLQKWWKVIPYTVKGTEF